MHMVGDNGDDGVWMTYGELASARRIKRAAAVRLVQRRRWRRQVGNDKLTRVLVPRDMVKLADEASRPDGNDIADDIVGDNASDVTALQVAIDALRGAHAGEIATFREQHGRSVAVLESRLADAERRAERSDLALAGERARADSLRDRLEAAERGQREAEEAAQALREADTARRARGLLARLRAAWRGD